MRIRRILVTAAVTLLATGQASAQTPHTAEEVKAQRNLWEIGLYLGLYLPPSDHELYDYPLPHREMDTANFAVGLRGSYLFRYFLGAELEGGLMPAGTTGASALVYSVRAHIIGQYPVWKRLLPFVVLGGGLLGVSSDDDALGSDVDGMFHWGLGAKYYVTDYLAVRGDMRHEVTNGLRDGLSNHFELLVGVSWVFGWRPAADKDKDGVPDARDRCPTEPAETDDGCPKRDTDGDGVMDDKDSCPKEPASTPNGCPPGDSDGDGITDDRDSCPAKPETQNGFEDDDGCPDILPAAVKMFTGTIRGITFDTGKSTIRKRSYETLDGAVRVLKDHPKIKLMIRGHTDNTGSAEVNTKLSLSRAEAVKAYLVEKGIDAERLSTEGLGPDEPVADNNTNAGRAKNRRIEFKLRR